MDVVTGAASEGVEPDAATADGAAEGNGPSATADAARIPDDATSISSSGPATTDDAGGAGEADARAEAEVGTPEDATLDGVEGGAPEDSAPAPEPGDGPDLDQGLDEAIAASCDAGTSPGACACLATSEIVTIPQKPANSGELGTTAPVCVIYVGGVSGWGVSNGDGRMVTAFGATIMGPLDATIQFSSPPSLAAGPDGFVYWVLTSGTSTFTSVFVY